MTFLKQQHRLIVLVFLLISGLFSQYKPINDSEAILLESSTNWIKNAETYHWLARHKNNDAGDLLKSQDYFQKAVDRLEALKNDTSNNLDSKIQRLIDKAVQGLEDSGNRYDNSFDNINNEYPLFDVITNRTKTFEFIDDPDVISINNAANALISVIPVQRKDFQYNAIVLSEPKNTALEDEIRVLLNGQAQFFPRPVEDILSVISIQEYEKLYHDIFNPDILKKIGEAWNKDKLILAKIVENDSVSDVTYMGLYIYEWDIENNKILRSAYEDGFVQDRRDFYNLRIIDIIIILIALLIISLCSKYIFFFKGDQDKRPVYFWTGIYSFILNLAILHILTRSYILLAPESMELAILPFSRFWIFSFMFFAAAVPFIITYLFSVFTPFINERLNDSETITSILSGVVFAQVFIFKTFHNLEFYDNQYSISYLCGLIVLYIIYLIWIGHETSKFLLKNKIYSIFALIGLILFQFNFIYGTMINEYFYLPIYLPFFGIIILSLVLVYFNEIKNNFFNKAIDILENQDIKSEEFLKQYFQKSLNNPNIFIDPSDKGDFVTSQVQFFKGTFDQKDKKLKVLLIEGPQGVGKTRMAREIASRTIEDYNLKNNLKIDSKDTEKWILFGDCDELNESGTGVPYEPFSQALHEILGAGRFEPPSKKANKIKEGLNNSGLTHALDIGGLGVLNLLLGTDDGEVKTATTNEMSLIVYQTLDGLSKKRPVVLIIDDLHWMDSITYSLFENLITKLCKKPLMNVFLIFTSRNNEAADSLKAVEFVKQKFESDKLDLNTISQYDFNYKERFDELLIRALKFDKNSAYRYLSFIKSYDVNNMLSVLQSLKSLINHDCLKYNNDQIFIDAKFNFSKLKPPTDIVDVVNEQLANLSNSQLQIIKFAAFIGQEFKASILTEALQLDRLQVLYDLENLEKQDMIEDIRSQDDVYEFKSSAVINVVRYMAKISDNSDSEIPQLVREYHYRVAQSIIHKMNSENQNAGSIDDQSLFSLAKRSCAAGDRMLKDAINYNFEALIRSFNQLRYEESIEFGNNILYMKEKISGILNSEQIIEIKLIMAQSMIILDEKAQLIDDLVEDSKKIIEKSKNINKDFWSLVVLNVEADALTHDHSEYFEKQRSEILDQLRDKINQPSIDSRFTKSYAKLSEIRLDSSIDHNVKRDNILNLLKQVSGVQDIEKETTKTPLSGFSNNSIIDYKILESEILEELTNILHIINKEGSKNNKIDDNFLKYLDRCIEIKSDSQINDQEGLANIYLLKGKFYIDDKNYIESKKYFEKTLKISIKIGNENVQAESYIGKAKINFLNQDYDKALDLYLESLKLIEDSDNNAISYSAYIGIMKIVKATNNKDLNKEYTPYCEALIKSDNNKGYYCEELSALMVELSKK